MNGTAVNILSLFPEYHPNEVLQQYFEEVSVCRVKLSTRSKVLHLYLSSDHLIPFTYQDSLCKELNGFVSRVSPEAKKLQFHLQYNLSGYYDIERILEEYKDSLMLMLKDRDPVFYLLLKDAGEDWVVADSLLTLPMPDNHLARSRAAEIESYLTEVFLEQFGLKISVGFSFREEDKAVLRAAHEARKQKELEDRLRQERLLYEKENESAEPKETVEDQSSEKAEASKKEKKASAKKAEASETAPKKEANTAEPKSSAGSRRFMRRSQMKISDDPEVFFGRETEGDITPISEIYADGTYCVEGQIIKLETREIKNKETGEIRSILYSFAITDYTDTIMGKIFVNIDDNDVFAENFACGKHYRLKGAVGYDDFIHEQAFLRIGGIKPIASEQHLRMDTSLEKRVELHMHTTMSEKDSVVKLSDIIKRAKAWGHRGIAITDHGVVHAFPEAPKAVGKDKDFKVIYGVEAYLVDDTKNMVTAPKHQTFSDTFVVFDIETTGKNAKFHAITEIGAVKIREGKIIDRYSQLVNPNRPIPYNITRLTGITDQMVEHEPEITDVLPKFLEFVGDSVVVAHNAEFDTGFIRKAAKEQGLAFAPTVVDTLGVAHMLMPNLRKFTLDAICKKLGVVLENHHRAVDDAEATAHMFLQFIHMMEERGIRDVDTLYRKAFEDKEGVKKLRRRHAIILAKNEVGRVHLYRLISESLTSYLQQGAGKMFPLMPKSLIEQYREGLILGSACVEGELYQALLLGADDAEIARIVNYYDYLEIQPIGNNAFLLEDDGYGVTTEEDLREKNREILRLGDEFGKLVVATGDVHYLDPEDAIYRSIIQASSGYKEADNQPPIYFHTTDEMLAEFAYLGEDRAREVVITNTNKIADMIEYIQPVRPDKCPPFFEGSDEELRKICYDKAHSIYGETLPIPVKERLDVELNSIISNGYAVLYIIAQKLVWHSNDRGYMVGSRGSVGSSFVATMAGITEVNPLPAHYICPKCHFVDFDSEIVKSLGNDSGCDLPDQNCPVCGEKLIKEGHSIPFETFLGFGGNKEPDIDLNFSGEDQPYAHRYTEELFPNEHAFRAGTITGVAEKTSFGMTKKYFEERNQVKRKCEIERLAAGCTGVRSSTGQHPGGMIVLPPNEEIYSFTPVQYPANDVTAVNKTTHFDYHKIEHNLLKLDILGHDDPSMIRRLEDLTGVKCTTIPLDDKDVIRLFQGLDVMGLTTEEMLGVKAGTLGIPEFGTDFAMQMLIDAGPKTFSDLVRISGFAHGTNVWQDNARDLIMSGTCELSTAIGCRDDIMMYLIDMGLEKGTAFKIMEKVRKGVVAKGKCDEWEEWKALMKEHDVPDWYIGSCEKIEYMFPKAHAVAYVTMGWRVGWYKLNYPLEYYAAYFSIRADSFDYETMCMGKDALIFHMKEIMNQEHPSDIDKNRYRYMRSALEMYCRGYEFMPMDIYRADAERFLIIDGKLMPALNSIAGIADSAASQIVKAVAEVKDKGGFSSKQNFMELAKIGKSTIEKFNQLHLLDGLPDTDQYSIFDFIEE